MKHIYFLDERADVSAQKIVQTCPTIVHSQIRRIAEIVKYSPTANPFLFPDNESLSLNAIRARMMTAEEFEDDPVGKYWTQSTIRVISLCSYAFYLQSALCHRQRRNFYGYPDKSSIISDLFHIGRSVPVENRVRCAGLQPDYHLFIRDLRFKDPPFFGPVKMYEDHNRNVYDAYRTLLISDARSRKLKGLIE
jgi:hypothetical protein